MSRRPNFQGKKREKERPSSFWAFRTGREEEDLFGRVPTSREEGEEKVDGRRWGGERRPKKCEDQCEREREKRRRKGDAPRALKRWREGSPFCLGLGTSASSTI